MIAAIILTVSVITTAYVGTSYLAYRGHVWPLGLFTVTGFLFLLAAATLPLFGWSF